jgi:hypothetical protein
MIGVTGSLAAENPSHDADVDFMLVSAPRRVWLSRAGAIAVVRLAGRSGVKICPNLALSTNALALDQTDLYTAHELLQLVPLSGPNVYRALLAANVWSTAYLPRRARFTHLPRAKPLLRRTLGAAGEALMFGPLGDCLDRWEWRRKSSRLATQSTGARFTRDVCEGHYGRHRDLILKSFEDQCARFGVKIARAAVGAPS